MLPLFLGSTHSLVCACAKERERPFFEIDRGNDSPPHQMSPDPVDHRIGHIRFGGIGDQFRELLPRLEFIEKLEESEQDPETRVRIAQDYARSLRD